MQKRINFIIFALSCVVAHIFSACGPMDATYVDFIKDGKIVYPGKTDSMRVYPGKNRIGLSWLLIDPNVVRTKIYWNNRADSVEISVEPSPGIDSMGIVLPDMAEGGYLFECFTYDNEGNQSIKVEVSGQVYGDLYTNSLLPKPIKRTVYGVDTSRIYWGEAEEGMIGTEVAYVSEGGALSQIFVPAADTLTKLPGVEGVDFRYRTLFLPDTMAIDTFYTAFTTQPLIDPDANLAAGKPVIGSSTCSCGEVQSITDTDPDTYWQPLESDRSDFNVWATVDLGAIQRLNKAYIYWSESEDRVAGITGFQLLVSDDGELWDVAFEKTAGIGMQEQVAFPEVSGRYVRLSIGLQSSQFVWRTHEIELYYDPDSE